MKKLCKYVPILCAAAWTVCLLIGVFVEHVNFRLPFIVSTATLVVTNIIWFLGENENVRPLERSDNKQGREPEPDSNDNE